MAPPRNGRSSRRWSAKTAARRGRNVALLLDLQGPKVRTGAHRDGQPLTLTPGQELTITTRSVLGTAQQIATTYQHLPADVQPGDQILLADGTIRLVVLAVEPEAVRTRGRTWRPAARASGDQRARACPLLASPHPQG
ncbi:MAG: hypothetical protein KatS3mg061_0274 [Dehalococcoidia bacterium]|nr:MAG: hypothetical protein KatS3mg061_0274 [Dehalococcoidia bacterium]